jgi:hypothetical protein
MILHTQVNQEGILQATLPTFFKGKKVVVSIVAENENIKPVSQLNEFQMFLLNSPEMSDEEYQFVQEKRRSLNQWK